MIRIAMIRPGATDFDDQGRITGTLDLPLNDTGMGQAGRAAQELASLPLESVYASPCQSAKQTAQIIAKELQIKVKELSKLANLDHGLWHGRQVEEVRQRQPKVYRQWQENPASICPPEGETLAQVQSRVELVFRKLVKRHTREAIAVVCPEPLASVAIAWLRNVPVGDIWKAECRCGCWDLVELEPEQVASIR
ncbi:MAG: histidine phosphatase family protein [Planctomycetes bacterium]|nr:histidine phosphatase family protein [Planctomycetota bacterium]